MSSGDDNDGNVDEDEEDGDDGDDDYGSEYLYINNFDAASKMRSLIFFLKAFT